MKAVIVGTDLMYDSNGVLKPIEINTNAGFTKNKIEQNLSDIFDMSEFQSFVTNGQFIKITYIGANRAIKEQIMGVSNDLSITFEHINVSVEAITVPYVEDADDHLIIRTSYDTTAILDDFYCKNKVNFLNLIKETDFGSQFAYINDDDILVSTIIDIKDNGVHPNFILKSKGPHYDKNVFPKFFNVSNQSELDVILGTLTKEYFLMECYFNQSKLYNGLVTKVRKISMMFPPNLESIHMAAYTDLTTEQISENITYDSNTFELLEEYRNRYLTSNIFITQPKLMDDDFVILADGTLKSGLNLQVGDTLKTIDIPNANNSNILDELVNYHIDINEFLSGTTYSTNMVTKKIRVDGVTEIYNINFTDDSTWSDTGLSSYLVESEGEIKFKFINDLDEGDVLLLLDTGNQESISVIQKTILSVNKINDRFSGWLIEVERTHVFLTMTSGNSTLSFAAVEHNNVECFDSNCYTPLASNGCAKGVCCCGGLCKICIN